jgi:tryptophan synthase alpha chain
MRIKNKFAELKSKNKKAFVSYIMACDPNEKLTAELLEKMPASGVDIIELGIPFSDPMAEGPAIQRAAERALRTKCNIAKCFELVKNFRKKNDDTPIVLMGYFNPIFVFGIERFCKTAKASGVDGVIIVDLPPEEEAEFTKYSNAAKLDFIRLTTPTTDDARAKKILKNASGFVYYIAVAGVTGVKEAEKKSVEKAVKNLRNNTKLPIYVGFGIKNAGTAKEISKVADGIVIGSAFINIIEKNLKTQNKAVSECVSFAKEIRKAIG